MSKEEKEILRVRYKMLILELTGRFGNVAKTCRNFDVTKSFFINGKGLMILKAKRD